MERLFWIQNNNPNTPNTLIDTKGTIITLDRTEEEGYELFNELLDYQETSKMIFRSGNLSLKKHPDGGIFISSNFLDKDDSGRKMGFMFFTTNTTKNEVIKDLLFYSGLVKRTLEDQDIENLNRNINNKNKQIVILIAAAITILLIYMIWKNNN